MNLVRSLVFSVFCAAIASVSKAHAQTPVGVLASFSGEWGSYGQAYRRGIEMADVSAKARFVYEDDGFLPARTVSAFRKLVDIDRISAVLVGDTVTAQAIAPIAERRKIPILAWASGDNAFANNPFGLRLWTSNAKDFSFMREAIQQRGYLKLALFTSTHTYTAAWASSLRDDFPGSTWEDFSTTPDSFQSSIVKVSKSGFDAIGVCLSAGLNGRFAKQLRALRITIPLFGCNFIESSADIEASDGAFDGVWFTAPRLSEEFMDGYRNRFGTSDHLVSAAVFHDAALLVTKTFDKPFAIAGLREVMTDGDRHLDFEYQVMRFRGGDILVDGEADATRVRRVGDVAGRLH